jgi:GxxExxY protein
MAIYARSHINKITEAIIGSAIEVHRHLGPGLFESAYHSCVVYELRQRGLRFTSRRTLPLTYKRLEIDAAYEIDLWVEDLIVVELKCVRELAPVHETQTLTYVKLTGAPVGLLINFYVPLLKDGIKRVINPEHEVIDDFDPTQRHKLAHAQTTAARTKCEP